VEISWVTPAGARRFDFNRGEIEKPYSLTRGDASDPLGQKSVDLHSSTGLINELDRGISITLLSDIYPR
jgi:hypothetical protein